MKKIVKLTEGDIHRIVECSVSKILKEHGMGLVGAYAGAQENLKSKIKLGVSAKTLPNGKQIDNAKHLAYAKQKLKEMTQEEFVKTFGANGVDLDCMCWYYQTSAYDFTFHMKSIEQINTNNFSILGDITNIYNNYLAPSLEKAIIPQKLTGVVLVYNFAKRTLSFTCKKAGLVIKPFDNGKPAWGKLLGLMATYNYGFARNAR